ncbi:hypothetical protein LCGC14_1790200, partial [marine sediment metagenome]
GSLSFRDERSMSREQAREGRRVFRKVFNFYHDRVAETIGEDPGCGIRDEIYDRYRAAGGREGNSEFRLKREKARRPRDRVTDNNFVLLAYEDEKPVGGAMLHAVKLIDRVGANVDYRAYCTVLTRPEGLGMDLLRWLLDNRHDARRDDGTLLSMRLTVLDFPIYDVRNRWRSDLPHADEYMKALGTYVDWGETSGYRYPLQAIRR